MGSNNGVTTKTNGTTVYDLKGETKQPSTSGHWFVLLFMLGLCMSSVASCASVFWRLQFPQQDVPIYIPEFTYHQSVSLSAATVLFMMVFVYQMRKQLFMASLGMPIVTTNFSWLPYLGQAPLFLKYSPWDLLLSWHRVYGPIYVYPLLGQTVVGIAHPDYLKVILQSGIKHVKKDVKFAYKPFLPILGHGIVTSEGQSWMKQRRKMSCALRINVLEIIPRITLEAVQRLFDKMDKAAENGTPIELAEALRHLTLQVISETFLSLSAEESDSTFAKMYLPIVDEGNKRVWHPERAYMFFMPSFWKHLRDVSKLNNYVSKLIRDRWALRKQDKEREHDMLDRVLDTYEKDFPNQDLTEEAVKQFRDEMKTFMLAGHETSAAMMTWALYELMGNETLMKDVSTEGQEVFGKGVDWSADKVDHTALPPREKLSELVLAEGCLKEALRKYAVVPIVTRRTDSPVQVGPHLLPAGCTININIQSVHHDPTYWPDPMTFDPRRFFSNPKPYTFLPFIDGPRNCLGQHLALLESKMVLALLTQRYNFKLVGGEVVTELGSLDRDPRHRYMVPVIPEHDFSVTVSRK